MSIIPLNQLPTSLKEVLDLSGLSGNKQPRPFTSNSQGDALNTDWTIKFANYNFSDVTNNYTAMTRMGRYTAQASSHTQTFYNFLSDIISIAEPSDAPKS